MSETTDNNIPLINVVNSDDDNVAEQQMQQEKQATDQAEASDQ